MAPSRFGETMSMFTSLPLPSRIALVHLFGIIALSQLLVPRSSAAQEPPPEARTVRSTDGQVELVIPGTMADRPTADVLVLSAFDFHSHRAITCTTHWPKLNDPIHTLADFAHKTMENSDLSGPRLSAPKTVKLETGLFAMQSERRIPDSVEPKFEIVTMVAVPKGFEAISIVFPEVNGKDDRDEMDKIINSLRLPQGGGQESSVPTTGPTTARSMRIWTTRNGLMRITLPDTFQEGGKKYKPNPEGLVAVDEDQRLAVSATSTLRSTGVTMGPVAEATRDEMLKSNFAAKATKP